jgi:hypothetical protein
MKLFVALCLSILLLTSYGFVVQKSGFSALQHGRRLAKSPLALLNGRKLVSQTSLFNHYRPVEGVEVPLEYSPVSCILFYPPKILN